MSFPNEHDIYSDFGPLSAPGILHAGANYTGLSPDMVSALLNDALSDPISLILSLHHSALSSNQDFASCVAQHFHAIFNHDDAFKQILPLDTKHPPECYESRQLPLVRFRAMVQDTSASPEIYPSFLRNGTPGGWGLADREPTDEPLDLQHLKEREVVWAISVPGESPFVAEHLDDADQPVSSVEISTSQLPHKDPLMRDKHVGAQVKLYDPTTLPLKPTELYSFVGFLSFELLSSGEGSAFVPTLHTLFSVKHTSTLISFKYPLPNHIGALSPGHDQLDLRPSAIREELVQWVSDEALGGDRDAALWVLLVSISRVQSRQPPLFPPALTLSRFPKPPSDSPVQPTPTLVHVLRWLLPIFVDVPLSLSLLNTRLFAPESHGESLHAGLLQLPACTTILLSDSGVKEGKFTEIGVKNIQTLRNVLTLQTINYHFPFTSPYQFFSDLSFIFLTEGRKSALVETQENVPLDCKNCRDCFRRPEDIRFPPLARLEAFRRLLGGAKVGDVMVTEEMSQHIQADFVRERQENKATTANDLMTRLTIARSLALLQHDAELTREVWQEAKDLDKRRKQRCAALWSPQSFCT